MMACEFPAISDYMPLRRGASALALLIMAMACSPAFAADNRDGTQPASPQGATKDAADAEEERALERALVEQGGLLLPPYVAEIAGGFNYTYNSNSGLQTATINNVPSIGNGSVRSDALQLTATGRIGLPWDLQAEVIVPYNILWQRNALDGTYSNTQYGAGVGDVEVDLRYQLLRARGAWPNLILSVLWKSDTGSTASSPNALSTGSGNQAVQAGITMVKSQDPLVFLGTVNYFHNFSATINGASVDRGDSVEVKFGPILAASPETSLRADLDTYFYTQTSINGVGVAGSDHVASVLDLGIDTILGRGLLLDAGIGIGVTHDTPNLQIMATLVYRL